MNKDKLLGIVRHGLTIGAGYLVGKHAKDSGINVEEVVGAVMTLVGVVWSVVSKPKADVPKP
jgi:hypothetical protein